MAEKKHIVKRAVGKKHPSAKATVRKAVKTPKPHVFSAESGPSRDEIKPKVISVINDEAERNSAPPGDRAALQAGVESTVLESQLKINKTRRKKLSSDPTGKIRTYSEISTSYPGGLRVTQVNAGEATTLRKAVDLVFNRANGK